MPGLKSSTDSRPGTALERKFSTFENYQARVAQEGEQIINEKLREKITELDELCMSGKFSVARLSEIRDYTKNQLQTYLDEVKRLEKKAAAKSGGGNPLLQLLAGGMGGAGAEAEEGEEMYEPEEGEEESAELALPRKLLLSKMAMDENNKINLKLSLELETPESKKKEASEEKSSSKKSKREAEKQEDEEPEPKKSKRTTRQTSAKKKKKDKEEEVKEIEEPCESSMSISEGKKQENEDDEEDEPEPVLQSHPEIYKLSTGLRRHSDELLDWITTIRQWIQSNMTRNNNIGGADLRAECQGRMLEELGVAEQEFASYKEIMAAYYVARATVLEKYVKCPEFEDYKNFLIDEDEKQFVTLRTIVTGMRNTTVNLFDGITKDQATLFEQSDSKQDNYAAFSMY